MKNVIPMITLALLVVAGGVVEDAVAQKSALARKIDSLFIIASSGEVRYRDQNEPAMDSIAALGRPAVPYLIDKFTTKSARERWTIIWTLERIGSAAVPDLIEALDRPDGLVVQRVAWALGSIKDSTAVGPLMGVANHPRWQVRDQAVGALGKIGSDMAEPVVIAAFDDQIGQVRKSAVVSAGKLGLEGGIDHLIARFDDSFYGARMAAVEALLKFDTTMVIDHLETALDGDPDVGKVAIAMLGDYATDRTIRILRLQLESSNSELVAAAALALANADPLDNCGFRALYLNDTTDRLTRLKIESAITSRLDELGQSR